MLPQQGVVLAKRFQVRAQIGYATLGWLYRALDQASGREVALRMVLGVRDADGARARLAALIESVSRLDHPGLAAIYECGVWEGQLWFTSEWLGGSSLEQTIAKIGALDPAEVARIGIAVANGLVAAHRQGVVHRGLKTRTIFVDRDRVVTAELGVAAAILADAPLLANTPGYIPPEQIADGVFDRRSDIYSLGCCLFAAAVGRPPFEGGSRAEVIAAQTSWRAPRARDRNPAVPEGLELLLLRAMATHPDDRFQSMAEFADALSRCQKAASARP